MSTPFLSAEPVSLQKQKEQETPKETPKETKKIPSELQPIFNLYKKVVENPQNVENLWNFTQGYLTFLETKSNMILPIIKESNPNIEGNSLMLALKESGITNIPWNVYNIFITISNIGSSIASKQTKDDKDQFYLIYVMLSFGDESPVFNFTELLKTLQTQDAETQKIYSDLNEKFEKAFAKYEKKDDSIITESFLDKSMTVPVLKKDIKVKWILIVATLLVLLIIAGITCWYYNPEQPIVAIKEVKRNVSGYESAGGGSIASIAASVDSF